jgi:hypothetical protein
MSLKNERDSTIQKLFARHNLGSLPNTPFSDEGALSHINRIKSRLMDLEKDMEDKKVTFFWLDLYFFVGVCIYMFSTFFFEIRLSEIKMILI